MKDLEGAVNYGKELSSYICFKKSWGKLRQQRPLFCKQFSNLNKTTQLWKPLNGVTWVDTVAFSWDRVVLFEFDCAYCVTCTQMQFLLPKCWSSWNKRKLVMFLGRVLKLICVRVSKNLCCNTTVDINNKSFSILQLIIISYNQRHLIGLHLQNSSHIPQKQKCIMCEDCSLCNSNLLHQSAIVRWNLQQARDKCFRAIKDIL